MHEKSLRGKTFYLPLTLAQSIENFVVSVLSAETMSASFPRLSPFRCASQCDVFLPPADYLCSSRGGKLWLSWSPVLQLDRRGFLGTGRLAGSRRWHHDVVESASVDPSVRWTDAARGA